MEEISSSDLLDHPTRGAWGEGPWNDEPDFIGWTDEETGYKCMILRGPVGSLNGYVAVPRYHAQFGKDYNDVDVWVHGGLTYAANGWPPVEKHCPEFFSNNNVWVFGFDTAHWEDYSPGTEALLREVDSSYNPEHLGTRIYRTVDYLKQNIKLLALQLKDQERSGVEQFGSSSGS